MDISVSELTERQKEFLSKEYRYWMDEGNGRFAAIYPFFFTCAIIDGPNEDVMTGYQRRWCYNSCNEAVGQFVQWSLRKFEGEPEGWHRAVDGTGRRRPHGNKEEEYIEF